MSCPTPAHTTTASCFDQHYQVTELNDCKNMLCVVNIKTKWTTTTTKKGKFWNTLKGSSRKATDRLYQKDSPFVRWNKLEEKKGYYVFNKIVIKTKYF